MIRTADEIRKELDAPDFMSITVWRTSPGDVAGMTSSPVAAHDAAVHALYAARFGTKETHVSSFEYDALLHAGATDVKKEPHHHGP